MTREQVQDEKLDVQKACTTVRELTAADRYVRLLRPLHMIDVERQRQRFCHVWSVGIGICMWNDSLGLSKKSKQFDPGDMTSDIAALILTLSVNRLFGNWQLDNVKV